MINYKMRTLEKKLNDIISEFPVILISGPRQVGKNTLLQFIHESNKQDIHYVILDDTIIKNNAKEDFDIVKKFGMEVENGIVLCMVSDIIRMDEENYLVPIEYI